MTRFSAAGSKVTPETITKVKGVQTPTRETSHDKKCAVFHSPASLWKQRINYSILGYVISFDRPSILPQ